MSGTQLARLVCFSDVLVALAGPLVQQVRRLCLLKAHQLPHQLKLEAILGTASAVLDAVALFGKRQAPWVDVERTNRQLRKAIVELVAPPSKTKK